MKDIDKDEMPVSENDTDVTETTPDTEETANEPDNTEITEEKDTVESTDAAEDADVPEAAEEETGESPEAEDAEVSESSSDDADKKEDKSAELMSAAESGELGNEDIKKRYPNWLDLLLIVAVFLGASIIAGGLMMLLQRTTDLRYEFLMAMTYTLQFAITIGFVIIHRKKRDAEKLKIGFSFKNINPPLILWGVMLVLVTSLVIEPLLMLFPERYLETLNNSIGTGGWAVVTTVLLAPILEEYLFRGLVLGSVRKKYGSVTAVLISALMFGLIHIIPQQVINAFVIGIILGYIYIRTGSIIGVMLIHALNNAVAFIMMELFGGGSAAISTRHMINNDTFYFIIYGICLVLLVIGVIGMAKTLKNYDKPAVEEKSRKKGR